MLVGYNMCKGKLGTNGAIWPWGIDRNVVIAWCKWAHPNMIMMLYVDIWQYMEKYYQGHNRYKGIDVG